MFKFIHAADLHLDSPLRGLARYEGAPVEKIRGATRQALANLVDLATAEEVDFLLIAGDIYDGDWKDYNTGLFFASQMSKLRDAGIKVFIIAGNHDAASQISRQLRMPDNVVRFSTRKPQTHILEHLGVAIHGQGFSKSAVTEDLSSDYPSATSGLFNIGMLHTSATGREGHEPYAPCTIDGLISKGYDYWALGHVHKREELCQDPMIVFPGNIQGRHIRETGAKGCTLVTVDEGRISLAEHRELDVLRWVLKELDASGIETAEEIIDLVCSATRDEIEFNDGNMLAMRLHIGGTCRAHSELVLNADRWVNEIRLAATDVSVGNVWIEKIKIQTQSQLDFDQMLQRDDAIGGLLRFIQELGADDRELLSMLDGFSDFRRKLPPELQQGDDAIDWQAPEFRRELIEDVKQILINRLLSQHNP